MQVANNLTVAGNLTVNGTLTSLDTTNLDIEDNLFQLNAGLTGSPVNDSGMLINRGSSDNGIFMWDESVDKFTLGLTTADGTTTGNITLSSLGTLVANVEGNVTGTIQTAAQPNITSLGTLTSLTIDNINIDGGEIDSNTNIIIDAAGDITLDADGGDFRFKDAGTTIATYSNVGGDWYITANSEDKDIVFQGNDGGSTVQALKLDMSDAGTAIFNNKVAIGTSSPTANRRLHIVSTAQNQAKFERSGAATSHIEFDDSTTTNQPSMGGVGDNLTFNTAFTERVRIDSSGNLGINETSPLGKLHVKSADSGASADGGADELVIEGSGDSGLSILSGASNYGNILFSDSGDAAAGRIRYEHDNNALNFGTNGSWDRFYINSAGNVGISNTSLNANLHIGSSNATGNTTNPALQIGGTSTYRLGMYTSAEGAVIENKNGDDGIQFKVKTNGEVMRIVGGAVGINTTAPFSDLSVNVGANAPSSSGNMASEGLTIHNASGGRAIQLGVNESGAYNYIQSSYVNNANVAVNLAFFTGASERLRIDTSGNLLVNRTSTLNNAQTSIKGASGKQVLTLQTTTDGNSLIQGFNSSDTLAFQVTGGGGLYASGNVGIGTSSPVKELQIGSATASVDANMFLAAGSNAYSRLYMGDATTGTGLYAGLLMYDHGNDAMTMFTSSTERMRIDSSGNVGIGTTSPNFTLGIHKATASSNYMQITNSDTGSGSGDGFLIGVASDEAATIWNQENTRMAFGTNNTERMRIESDGDLKIFGTIGTNSSTAFASMAGRLIFDNDYSDTQRGPNKILLQNDGAWIAGLGVSNGSTDFYTGGNFTFRTGTSLGSERMRIDSSGRVQINTTTSDPVNVGHHKFVVELDSSTAGIAVGADGLTDSRRAITFYNDNGTVGSIITSGSSTSYNTSSDYRLKENVNYEFNALDRVAQLKPARFNFIADADTTVDGFLAHEVQDIVPEAISGVKDGEQMQGIDQSKLVPLLTKAIQEQQEQIEELKQEIQNLKGE